MTTGRHLYRVVLQVPPDKADAFAGALEAHCDSVSWTARPDTIKAQVTGFSENPPDDAGVALAASATAAAVDSLVPDVKIERIPVQDWVVENLKEFPPLTIGRFFIHGANYEEALPAAKISIEVPAAAAFGTGSHGSTMGCLLALDGLNATTPEHALDMGCGSGILALAIAKRWRIPVTATDIDPRAVATAAANARVNGEAVRISCAVTRGYRHRLFQGRYYDLIVSNILARPLCRMAKDLIHHLAPGGTAILAGLMTEQEARVLNAHRQLGLQLFRRYRIDGWTTLVLQKRGHSAF